MLVVATYDFAGSVVVEYTMSVEDWFRVARSERFELSQDADELRCDVGELESCINFDLRSELMLLDVVGYIFFETASELFEVFFFERKTSRIGVTTEVFEQIAARVDSTIEVETLHGTSRATDDVVGLGEHYGRFVVFLGKARSNDADDAFVPIRVVDHDRAFVALHFVGDELFSLGGSCLVDIFALFVVAIDVFAELARMVEVVRDEEFDHFATRLHTARSIDARTDFEDNVVDRDVGFVRNFAVFVAFESARFDDGFESTRRVLVEAFDAEVSEDAVFASDRHDVGSNADSYEIEESFEMREVDAIVDGKGLHELESYATAREVLVGVGVVGAFGVEDSHSPRKSVVGSVVVANDEIDAKRRSIVDLLDGFDATVERDDERDVVLLGVVDAIFRDAIPLFVSVGDIEVELRRLDVGL